jgi:hypothetical protein
MTLTVTRIDGAQAMVLLGLTVAGKPRQWKRPLRVELAVTSSAGSSPAKGAGPPAPLTRYALSAPTLGVEAPPSASILEAVWKLQDEIVTALPVDVLESLLIPLTSA